MAVELLERPGIERGIRATCPAGVMREDSAWATADDEANRVRAVFGLSVGEPLPRANIHTLLVYQRYLAARLTFPFQALYAETKPPVRQLFRYVSVLDLVDGIRSVSEGIRCHIAGLASLRELPLVEIGLREDSPFCTLIDDYASWLVNWR